MAYETKCFAVQKFDREGKPGELLAVKLTWSAAHAIAKRHAPAKVMFIIADKTEQPNVDQKPYQPRCN